LDSFDVAASSIAPKTFDYLSSLEWVRAQQNLMMVGPAGTGKSHTLIGLGIAAIHAGHKVRYFTAADLVETLYRGLADNTVGKIIESLLRVDLIILDLSRPRDYAEGAERVRGKPLGSELLIDSNLSDCSA
jgi:DNA replication protein DnaC